MSIVKEVKQDMIKTEDDIVDLGFLDWNRPLCSTSRDMRGLKTWLCHHMKYTLIEVDLRQSPHRNDFPKWKHIGAHAPLGQLYWNWFYSHFSWIDEKELVFSDSPDFWGFLTFPPEHGKPARIPRFWGDIGRVSIPAFATSLFQMRPGDLWITLYDETSQLVLEACGNFFEASDILLDATERLSVCNEKLPVQRKKHHTSIPLNSIQASLWT